MKKFLFTVAILAGSLTFASTVSGAEKSKEIEPKKILKVQKESGAIPMKTSCGKKIYVVYKDGDTIYDVLEAVIEADKDVCGKKSPFHKEINRKS